VQVLAGHEGEGRLDEERLDEVGGEEPGTGQKVHLHDAVDGDVVRRVRQVQPGLLGPELAVAREREVLLPERQDPSDAPEHGAGVLVGAGDVAEDLQHPGARDHVVVEDVDEVGLGLQRHLEAAVVLEVVAGGDEADAGVVVALDDAAERRLVGAAEGQHPGAVERQRLPPQLLQLRAQRAALEVVEDDGDAGHVGARRFAPAGTHPEQLRQRLGAEALALERQHLVVEVALEADHDLVRRLLLLEVDALVLAHLLRGKSAGAGAGAGLRGDELLPVLRDAGGPRQVRLHVHAEVHGGAHVVEQEGGVDGEGELEARQRRHEAGRVPGRAAARGLALAAARVLAEHALQGVTPDDVRTGDAAHGGDAHGGNALGGF